AGVEGLSLGAEVEVVRIAEGEDGVAELFETGVAVGAERLPESGGVVGRVAVAPSAGDEEEGFLAGEVEGGEVLGAETGGVESRLGEPLREAFGEGRAVAALARVKHGDAWARAARDHGLVRGGGEQAGE